MAKIEAAKITALYERLGAILPMNQHWSDLPNWTASRWIPTSRLISGIW